MGFVAGMTTIRCITCDVRFGITETMEADRRQTGDNFYCPNGHRLSWSGELDRLRKQVAAKDYAIKELRSDLESERTRSEKLDKKLKRVEHGVCPKCNRTFHNLRRHMKTKHGVKKKKGRLPK